MATNNSFTDPCLEPVRPNPSGAPPNFYHHVTIEPIVIAVGVPLIVLSFFFVVLRITDSLRKELRLFIDDYLCCLAWLLSSVCFALEMKAMQSWTHAWDMSVCQLGGVKNEKIRIASFLLSSPAALCAKAAICFLYLRLFGSVQWLRYITWTVFIAAFLSRSISFTLALINFAQKDWDMTIAGGLDLRPSLIAASVQNILSDLVLLALPVQPIMKLSLTLRRRIGLLGVFLVGFVSTIFALLHTAYLVIYYYRVAQYEQNNIIQDWTWTSGVQAIYALTENPITIIMSCVPGIVSLWRNSIRETYTMNQIRSILGWPMSSPQDARRQRDLVTIKITNMDKGQELQVV